MNSLPARLKRVDVYEEKVAQEAAGDALASFSQTLLQARAAGVPAPVMRLRLMQVSSAPEAHRAAFEEAVDGGQGATLCRERKR